MSKKPPVAQVRISPENASRLDRLRDAIAPAELTHPAIYKAGLDALEMHVLKPATVYHAGQSLSANFA
jgi:hypothetical protein